MELFCSIPEFKPQNVFQKFNEGGKGYLTIKETKLGLFFIFGRKVKSEQILMIIKGYLLKKELSSKLSLEDVKLKTLLEQNNLLEADLKFLLYTNYSYIKDSISISYHLFETLVSNLSREMLNNGSCLMDLYKSLLYPDKKQLDYFTFKQQISKQFPSLNETFIQNVFFHLNSDKSGVISFDQFVKAIIPD